MRFSQGGFVRIKKLTKEAQHFAGGICAKMDRMDTTQRLRLPDLASRVDKRLLRSFRAYVPPPVLKKLDNHQSLDYLSEMRSISIGRVGCAAEGAVRCWT